MHGRIPTTQIPAIDVASAAYAIAAMTRKMDMLALSGYCGQTLPTIDRLPGYSPPPQTYYMRPRICGKDE